MADQLAGLEPLAASHQHLATAVDPTADLTRHVAIEVFIGAGADHQAIATGPPGQHITDDASPPVTDRGAKRSSDIKPVVGLLAAPGAGPQPEMAGVAKKTHHREDTPAPAGLGLGWRRQRGRQGRGQEQTPREQAAPGA